MGKSWGAIALFGVSGVPLALGCTGSGGSGGSQPPSAAAFVDNGPTSSSSSVGTIGEFPVTQPVFGATVTANVPPPPISGGTLAVLQDGVTAVVSDPDRDAVYVVNLTQQALRSTVTLQPGDEPGRLVEDGAGLVHVALRGGGAVVTIDPMSGQLLDRQSAGPAPRGIAWDAVRGVIWVANATGEVFAFPAAGGAATTSLLLSTTAQPGSYVRDLRDVIVNEDGSLTITTFRSAALLRVDASSGAVIRQDGVSSISVPPASTPAVAWRARPGCPGTTIVVHQAQSELPIDTTSPGAYAVEGALPTVSMVTVVNDEGAVTESLQVPAVLPVDVATSKDGATFAVAAAGHAYHSGLSPVIVGRTLACTPPVSADAGSEANPSDAGAVDVSADGPGDGEAASTGAADAEPTATAADGGAANAGPTATAAHGGAADDAPEEGGPSFGPTPPVPAQPALFDSGFPQIPMPPDTGAAVAVAFDGAEDLIVQVREPAQLIIVGLQTLEVRGTVVLSTASRDDTGHDIFHASAGASIACASCHPEGGDDGHVWDLNNAPRRTPSLRGTIAGTAPYHWPGDEKDLPTLVLDVYTGRMEGAVLPSDEMNALVSWAQTIPGPPKPTWIDAAAVGRGEALFESTSVGCSSCHSGAKFTNNQTMNVGTGQPFQVPPLVGVGWRGPFMHDGCAQTLTDRFTKCATAGHGNTQSLSTSQISDIVAYLESL
jgi:hypothetical protein